MKIVLDGFKKRDHLTCMKTNETLPTATITAAPNASLSRTATRWFTITSTGGNKEDCTAANKIALGKIEEIDSSVDWSDSDYRFDSDTGIAILEWEISMEPYGTKAAELKRLRKAIK